MRLAERADHAWDERVERGRTGKAEPDAPGFAARGTTGRGSRVLDPVEDHPRLGKERLAGLGQLHAAGLAAEQLYFELGFERPDLLAERRLLDAEPLGRARHMPLLGDRDEIAKVTQLHDNDT